MHLTVEQALSVYPLTEAKLVAGSAGSNRIIRAVNVMDAPDITDWIKEGEMLFTTAYLIKDNLEAASRLLAELDRRGSSGLGIKLGRFWDVIPEPLLEQADRLSFPLIELPYQFTFSDQMNGLFREELKRSTSVLHDTLEKQIRLMRFALQSDPIRQLFERVGEVIGHPLAVIGSAGKVIYNSSDIPEGELLGRWPWPVHHQWAKGGGWQAFRIPLMKQSQCTGFVLFFNPQPLLTPIEESLYFQAAELIAFHLNFNYEDYLEHTAVRDFGQLVKRHLKNGLPAEALLDYASRWGYDLFGSSYRCVLIDLPCRSGTASRGEELEGLKAELLRHSRIQQLRGLHLAMEEGVLSIIPDPEPEDEEGAVSAFSASMEGMLADERGLRAAVSTRKKSADGLKGAFDECLDALRLAKDWNMRERVVLYETVDLALLFERVPQERMRAFCMRWLGGLDSRDPEYVREMLRTLETYLECDGQMNETAKRLFIHRNTATYRIEKLGELLDVDFKKVNDLLRLKIAFLFRRMLKPDQIGGKR